MKKIVKLLLLWVFSLCAYASAPTTQELTDLFNVDAESALEYNAAASLANANSENRYIGYCTGKEYNRLMDDYNRKFQRGESLGAMAVAVTAARTSATCATVSIRKGMKTNYSAYAMQVGSALVFANAARQIKNERDTQRAIRYLEYAEANGVQFATTMLNDLRKKK